MNWKIKWILLLLLISSQFSSVNGKYNSGHPYRRVYSMDPRRTAAHFRSKPKSVRQIRRRPSSSSPRKVFIKARWWKSWIKMLSIMRVYIVMALTKTLICVYIGSKRQVAMKVKISRLEARYSLKQKGEEYHCPSCYVKWMHHNLLVEERRTWSDEMQ